MRAWIASISKPASTCPARRALWRRYWNSIRSTCESGPAAGPRTVPAAVTKWRVRAPAAASDRSDGQRSLGAGHALQGGCFSKGWEGGWGPGRSEDSRTSGGCRGGPCRTGSRPALRVAEAPSVAHCGSSASPRLDSGGFFWTGVRDPEGQCCRRGAWREIRGLGRGSAEPGLRADARWQCP